MTLREPLFLAALGLLVPLVLAYLVRRRNAPRPVPSTLLWRRVARSRFRSRRMKWLTRLLSLLACALGLGALVLAATRPASAHPGELLACVVDASASMSAGGGDDAPIARARREIAGRVAARGLSDRFLLILADETPRVLAGPTDDEAALEAGLSALEAGPGSADLGAALDLAASLVVSATRTASSSARIVLYTDGGQPSGAPSFDRRGLVLTERRLGPRGRDNVGVTTFAAQRAADAATDDDRDVLVAVATSSARARRVRVRLEAEGLTLARRTVLVPARGEADVRLRVHAASARLTARVEAADRVADALGADDVAVLSGRPAGLPRVLLAGVPGGPTHFFLEQAALAAGARAVVTTSPSELAARLQPGDVVVAFGAAPSARVDAPTVFVATRSGAIPGRPRELSAGDVALPLRSIDSSHPLMRGVALDGVTIHRAVALATSGDAHELAELDGGTVVATGGAGRRAWAWIGIDPAGSDLALRVAFPVLVANALGLVAGEATLALAPTLPRREVELRRGMPFGPAEPRPPWSPPITPVSGVALGGALLLALELWAFRRGWVS